MKLPQIVVQKGLSENRRPGIQGIFLLDKDTDRRNSSIMPPNLFHPVIERWFSESFGEPTAVQAEAWPLIARGEHVLALAPTGSGKTLTAFLGAISRFAEGIYDPRQLSVLYISPLKALNEDIRRNLLEPLSSLRLRFEKEGIPFPDIRAETRSGDTPQAERRRFIKSPPSILATTPESLAILLLNSKGRQTLSAVKCLIIDEIHAVLGTKRGTFLSCQLDRLSLIAGEFQRIALSATVNPPERAAEFAGGLRPAGGPQIAAAETLYERRPVRIAAPAMEKKIDLVIEYPAPAISLDADHAAQNNDKKTDRYGARYRALVETIMSRIAVNRTTLVFTDSRRRAERIAFLLNERAGKTIAFAHHGSLSKEVRRSVEARLAEGSLPCVAATGSLELGIDIGSVDEVILAGTPNGAAAALQRIGRSGHGVGITSRGRLIPFHGMDLLCAAALGGAVRDRELEPVHPIETPLDILAQLILALCAEEAWNADTLYHTLRGFSAFEKLPRPSFDRTVRMLAGRYASSRLRDLKPRLYIDGEDNTLSAADGTLLLLYSSGGVIPNRGSYSMRLADGTKIGELDEEFVWERRTGDSFSFGTRSWSIVSIGPEAVEVAPLERPSDFVPFWKAETLYRSPVLVRRMLDILGTVNRNPVPDTLDRGSPLCRLLENTGFSGQSFQSLLDFIKAQQEAQKGIPLPEQALIPVEIIDDPVNRGDAYQIMLHSFRGGAVNYPLSFSLTEELEERLGVRIESVPDDNSILILLPRCLEDEPEKLILSSLRNLGKKDRAEGLFRKRLESSGVFGAQFREAAERSLLLPKAGFGKRSPLWIMRQRSKRLFDSVSSYGDFPAIAEAWRSCLTDLFDMEGFRELIGDLASGTVKLAFFRSREPSPFAREVVWKETNRFLYEGDERPEAKGMSLSEKVIQDALTGTASRPSLPFAAAADFTARLRRELPGWAPDNELALAEWVKERIAIPLDEWRTLLDALDEGLRLSAETDPSLQGRIRELPKNGGALPVMVHRELAAAWEEDSLSFLGPWLRYEGPLPAERIAAVFAVSTAEAEDAAEALEDEGELVRDLSVEAPALKEDEHRTAIYAGNSLVCDRENLGMLLRSARRKRRRAVKERPISLLLPFLARRQGIAGGVLSFEKILSGYPLPAGLWEQDVFPARNPEYKKGELDDAIHNGGLVWYGAGKGRCSFCAAENLDLVLEEGSPHAPAFAFLNENSMAGRAMDFWELKDRTGLDSASLTGALWDEVWKGRLSSDSWEAVRRALENGFKAPEKPELPAAPVLPGGRRRRIPPALRDRWKSGAPLGGRWFSLVPDYAVSYDPLDEEEINRERVRLLLRRWGILCRPLLERESGPLSWGRLLPAMRRMELAGELMAGRFIGGINSLQFASADIEEELEQAEAEQRIYWLNAADPASPVGLFSGGLDKNIPSRLSSSRICCRGDRIMAVSQRNGKELSVFAEKRGEDIHEILGFLRVPRTRSVQPERKITIEHINGEGAAHSPYAEVLRELGFEADRERLVLW
ncbi:DEAD/DEAH box helicase [Treponema sp. OttesenSCG-928-L16]|nr:DEAD/DEAH box helicase [Treponema sp. OttesenSCG-928-L16]